MSEALALIIHKNPDIDINTIAVLINSNHLSYRDEPWFNRTPLIMAMLVHRYDIFQYLIQEGVNINWTVFTGGHTYNILTFGVHQPPIYLETIFATGKLTLDIEQPDINDYSLLAFLFGAINITTNSKIRFDDDFTPMINLFLAQGANINRGNRYGVSIYDCALTLYPRYMRYFQ